MNKRFAKSKIDTVSRRHDIHGRAYAKLSALKIGDHVVTDSGFTCMAGGDRKEVKRDETNGALYVNCRDKYHDLAGQLEADGDTLIGIYPDPKPGASA